MGLAQRSSLTSSWDINTGFAIFPTRRLCRYDICPCRPKNTQARALLCVFLRLTSFCPSAAWCSPLGDNANPFALLRTGVKRWFDGHGFVDSMYAGFDQRLERLFRFPEPNREQFDNECQWYSGGKGQSDGHGNGIGCEINVRCVPEIRSRVFTTACVLPNDSHFVSIIIASW